MLHVGSAFLLLLHASSGAAQSQPFGKFCLPELSLSSACWWTADCAVRGCKNRCIVNGKLAASDSVLYDRAVDEDNFQACPLIAYWVNPTVGIVRSANAGRRLQSDSDLADVLWTSGTASPDLTRLAHLITQAAATGSFTYSTDTDTQHRHMLDFLAEAPAPGPAPSPGPAGDGEDIPRNPCPTVDDIDTGAFLLRDAASRWRMVFETAARGEELSADLAPWAPVLAKPNQYQFLVKLFEDTDKLVEYVVNNCMDSEVEGTQSLFYFPFFQPAEFAKFKDPEYRARQCVDNFGGVNRFLIGHGDLLSECSPPFGATPDCFNAVGSDMITSESCAGVYGRLFGMADITTLINIANTVTAIHTACQSLTNEETCMSARTPALKTIDDLHASIPVKNSLKFQKSSPADVLSIPTVCFVPPCKAESEVPGVAPEPSIMGKPLTPRSQDLPATGSEFADNAPLTPEDVGSGAAGFSMAVAAAAAYAAIFPVVLL